jgi:HSP20 family molecular chaperone IbpA
VTWLTAATINMHQNPRDDADSIVRRCLVRGGDGKMSSTALQKAPETKDSTSLKLVEPTTLFERMNKIHDAIEHRAFEIFVGEGGIFGHELDNWFKAEGELLHPVHVNISESDDSLEVEAEVPGFDAKDLEVSVERGRLTISGRKESKTESKKGKTSTRNNARTKFFAWSICRPK